MERTGHRYGGRLRDWRIYLTGILIYGQAGLQLRWKWMPPDYVVLSKMFKIGVPGAFDIGTLVFSQLLFLALINKLGEAAAAAHGLAVQIEACAFLPGAAFQTAAATMAGQYIGAKMPQEAIRSVWQCLSVGGAIMCTSGVVLYLYGIDIASVFTGDRTDPTTQNVAELLKVVAFALPCLAVVMIVSGSFRGAGDTKWQFYFTAIGFFVLRIPLAIYLCFDTFEVPIIGWEIHGLGFGVIGAWYAMAFDLIIRSMMIAGRFFHGGWKQIEI